MARNEWLKHRGEIYEPRIANAGLSRRFADRTAPQDRALCERVNAHLAENISIDALAELAELSPFHFSRVFKQTTGITPLQFVTRERMLQAQQLIRQTSRSLIEIALEAAVAQNPH